MFSGSRARSESSAASPQGLPQARGAEEKEEEVHEFRETFARKKLFLCHGNLWAKQADLTVVRQLRNSLKDFNIGVAFYIASQIYFGRQIFKNELITYRVGVSS